MAVVLPAGSAVVMTGWFQTEFQHKTVPSNEWKINCWPRETLSARNPPTNDKPRIVISGRFIKNHNCVPRSLSSTDVAYKKKAATPAAPKNDKTRELEKQKDELELENNKHITNISFMQNERSRPFRVRSTIMSL